MALEQKTPVSEQKTPVSAPAEPLLTKEQIVSMVQGLLSEDSVTEPIPPEMDEDEKQKVLAENERRVLRRVLDLLDQNPRVQYHNVLTPQDIAFVSPTTIDQLKRIAGFKSYYDNGGKGALLGPSPTDSYHHQFARLSRLVKKLNRKPTDKEIDEFEEAEQQ